MSFFIYHVFILFIICFFNEPKLYNMLLSIYVPWPSWEIIWELGLQRIKTSFSIFGTPLEFPAYFYKIIIKFDINNIYN